MFVKDRVQLPIHAAVQHFKLPLFWQVLHDGHVGKPAAGADSRELA